MLEPADKSAVAVFPVLRVTCARVECVYQAVSWTLTAVVRRCVTRVSAPTRAHCPPLTAPAQPSAESPTTDQSASVPRDCRATPRWSAGRWSAGETASVSQSRVVWRAPVSTCVSCPMLVESMLSAR